MKARWAAQADVVLKKDLLVRESDPDIAFLSLDEG